MKPTCNFSLEPQARGSCRKACWELQSLGSGLLEGWGKRGEGERRGGMAGLTKDGK